ncbi:MAG: hypothetical protein EBR30_29685, partial [Cytophagia bacterium]|nr:hypothetical protein [Cytophagia bacterium]
MIRSITLSFMCFVCFYTQAQNAFTYSVELKQPPSKKTTLLLVEYELGVTNYTDSLLFSESVNLITKRLAQPVAATIRLESATSGTQVFLANNVLSISTNQDKLTVAPYALEQEFLLLSQNDVIRPTYFPLYGELNERKDSIGL